MLTLIAVMLAQVDGGQQTQQTQQTIYDKCPAVEFADGGIAPLAFETERTGSFLSAVEHPDGGHDFYMPNPRPQRISCKLAACEERVTELDAWGRSLPLPWWAALSISVAAAFAAGWGTWELCSHVPAVCGGK